MCLYVQHVYSCCPREGWAGFQLLLKSWFFLRLAFMMVLLTGIQTCLSFLDSLPTIHTENTAACLYEEDSAILSPQHTSLPTTSVPPNQQNPSLPTWFLLLPQHPLGYPWSPQLPTHPTPYMSALTNLFFIQFEPFAFSPHGFWESHHSFCAGSSMILMRISLAPNDPSLP